MGEFLLGRAGEIKPNNFTSIRSESSSISYFPVGPGLNGKAAPSRRGGLGAPGSGPAVASDPGLLHHASHFK